MGNRFMWLLSHVCLAQSEGVCWKTATRTKAGLFLGRLHVIHYMGLGWCWLDCLFVFVMCYDCMEWIYLYMRLGYKARAE